jgi:hypothetical protein
MHKTWSLIAAALLTVFCLGCSEVKSVWVSTQQYYPTWTPETTIVYLEIETVYPSLSSFSAEHLWTERVSYLCEMDPDGENKRRLHEIHNETREASGTATHAPVDGAGRICVSRHSIVYQLHHGEVWLATRRGLPIRKIADFAIHPTISPDGRKVAFEKTIDGVWTVDLATGISECIARSDGFGMPVWSPDVRHLAMMYKGRQLFLYDSDARSLTGLWESSDLSAYVQPVDWSNNGSTLTCLSLGNLLRFDRKRGWTPDTIATSLGVVLGHPRLSPDEDTVLTDAASIYKTDLAGTQAVKLAESADLGMTRQHRR